MSSIPITIAPQTAWGRPIQDAYWFCWVSGFNLCITMGALGYCMITKGFRKDLGTIMQYICHFFAIINIWMCYFNLLYPFGCDPMPWSTYAFSISEIACDSYLLMIVIALIPPGGASQKKKYAWYVLYFLCEYVTRILQYVFISYAPIFTLCRAVTHPTVSLVTTFFKIAFIVAMGVAMVLTLFASKSDVVSTVGFKSIIAAILMILAKIVLFIPFGTCV
jgi:hypothetical protein